jgi:hypothetical protein
MPIKLNLKPWDLGPIVCCSLIYPIETKPEIINPVGKKDPKSLVSATTDINNL